MSRRSIVPVVLLTAAACSLAAVFAVQRIERRGGPLSEPFATPYLSPGSPTAISSARITFRARDRERLTIEVRTADERVVRTVVEDRAYGPGRHVVGWDGTDASGRIVPDGSYEIVLTREGDGRRYGPARRTIVDTEPPTYELDVATVDARRLIGLAFVDEGTRFRAERRDDGRKATAHSIRPVRPDLRRPRFITPADGLEPLRFNVRLGTDLAPDDVRVWVVDRAGNRTEIAAADIETALDRGARGDGDA